MRSYIVKKIKYTKGDGHWCNSTSRELEEFIKQEGLEKEAQELFQRKRKYIKSDDGRMFRFIWEKW